MFAVLVAENEVASGKFAVKDLKSGEQTKVARGGLAKCLNGQETYLCER
jgi:histidyl-tRNA synthetase